jgi:glycine dehydrogenase subunit 1
MAGWGAEGFKKLGELNISKSRYAFEQITKIPGFSPAFSGRTFFNEFAVKSVKSAADISAKLLSNKIIGPLALESFYPEMKNTLLFCVTETKTKEDIDNLVKVLSDK